MTLIRLNSGTYKQTTGLLLRAKFGPDTEGNGCGGPPKISKSVTVEVSSLEGVKQHQMS